MQQIIRSKRKPLEKKNIRELKKMVFVEALFTRNIRE